jgi:hypothetical protein
VRVVLKEYLSGYVPGITEFCEGFPGIWSIKQQIGSRTPSTRSSSARKMLVELRERVDAGEAQTMP